ncbi:MAG: hypothetical protein QCI82_12225 [Candidatus Thermoplasmatota archaeon]|nr:hypothetical protein [Candidatus Thermoplasmatota archaeon]
MLDDFSSDLEKIDIRTDQEMGSINDDKVTAIENTTFIIKEDRRYFTLFHLQ